LSLVSFASTFACSSTSQGLAISGFLLNFILCSVGSVSIPNDFDGVIELVDDVRVLKQLGFKHASQPLCRILGIHNITQGDGYNEMSETSETEEEETYATS
jgi:hypothetical protein